MGLRQKPEGEGSRGKRQGKVEKERDESRGGREMVRNQRNDG